MVHGGQQMASSLESDHWWSPCCRRPAGLPPWLGSSERLSHFVVPAPRPGIVVLSALEPYPLFNLRTSHFLRSSDVVRGQLRGRSRLSVATLRECNHWSLGRVD
jgi:hypothetical protein